MHYSKALIVCAYFVVAAFAQSKIAFTQVPGSVQAGVSTDLKWSGGDGSSPVTITLKKGDPNNLQTIAIITGGSTGTSYTWTPSQSLPDGQDYALQITQGQTDVNYSGQFSSSGGTSGSGSASASGSSATASASASSATASVSGSSATTVTSSVVAVVTTTIGSLTSSTGSSSTTATVLVVASNATITSVSQTLFTTTLAPTGGAASGSAVSVPRNTTFVSQTLTGSSSATDGVSIGTGSSTATKSSGPSGTSSPSATSTTAGAAGVGSPLAFVLCAFVAMMYLN